MMKKMNFIAILAIITTSNQLSAMSSAKMAALKFAYAGMKAEQTVTSTFKKHPKLKTAAKVVTGIVALNIVLVPLCTYILLPIVEKDHEFNLRMAHEVCGEKELKSLETEFQKIDTIHCRTCLKKQMVKKLAESLEYPGSKEFIIDQTIASKCNTRLIKNHYSLSRLCETCNPSKKSSTK